MSASVGVLDDSIGGNVAVEDNDGAISSAQRRTSLILFCNRYP